MNETLLAVLGIAAPIVNTAGLFPYLRDIFRRKTKPERATWWIWLVLNSIAFFAQWAAGAHWSLLMTAGNVLAVGIIAVLSVWYGYGKLERRDVISLIVAGIGVILSFLWHSPLTALITIIGVDTAGFWLTIAKSWEAPHTETLISWVLATTAALCGLLAVGSLNLAQILYPVYVFVGNAVLVSVIVYRRKRL